MARDPFAFPDPFGTDPFASFGGGRRPAAYPPLEEAEAQSAIAQLTDAGLSTLGYVGGTLDKLFGGRAVRGALGGNARELLSAIPGSDTFGWTDAKQAVSGEDLLRNVGYDPSKGTWLERNLVGPAVEIGLDPSTYLGGIGALKALGKARRAEGTLTRGFLPAVRAGERSLMYGLSGPAVADAAEGAIGLAGRGNDLLRRVPAVAKAEDKIGAFLKQAELVRRARFDHKAGFVPNAHAQAAHEFDVLPLQDARTIESRTRYARRRNDLQPYYDAGMDPDAAWRYWESQKEGVRHAPHLAEAEAALAPEQLGALDLDIARSRARNVRQVAEERAMGKKSPQMRSIFGLRYSTRQSASAGRERSAALEKLFPHGHPSENRRLVGLDVPGGSVQIEDLAHDLRFAGAAALGKEEAREALLNEVYLPAFGGADILHELDPRFVRALRQRANQLAGVLRRHDPATPFWNKDFIATDLVREQRGLRALSGTKGVYGVIGRGAAEAGADAEGMAVPKLLLKAKLGGVTALDNAFEAMATHDPDLRFRFDDFLDAQQQLLDDEAAHLGKTPGDVDVDRALRDFLGGYKLAPGDADAASKLFQRFAVPEESRLPRFWGDSLLNLFKAGAYSIWPASHGRNLTSGVAENALEGTVRPGVYGDSRRLLKGETPPVGVADYSHLPASEQALRFKEEAYGHGILGDRQGELQQRVGVRAPAAPSSNPSAPRPGLREIAGRLAGDLKTKEGWNPLGVAGVGKRTEDTFGFARAGTAIGGGVEDNLRLAQFLDLRRKGYTAVAARDAVERTHFNYAHLADFEKDVMKRLVPFYTFSRFNLPKQARRAVAEPAKVLGPLRATGEMGDDEGYVPEYLRSGLSVPLGDAGDGTQSFLTGLGLPFEEALGRLKLGRTKTETAQLTGMGLLGSLRPELKGALELVTGKQFYTGRDLADLEPGKVAALGGIVDDEDARLVSQALANSPLSRTVSTVNRLLDERKHTPMGVAGLLAGLATGTRVTDVDVGKWRTIDARRAAEKLMREQEPIRELSTFYVKPEDKGTVTPEQAKLIRLNAYLVHQAKEAAKLKKQEQRRIGVRAGY